MAKRILVIDDHPEVRKLIRRVLEMEGYELSEMESAINLEMSLDNVKPDLILCDLLMPGPDGLAVCKKIRSNPETRGIQVIVVSAKTFEEDKRAALDAGACGYVVKPINPVELTKLVREVLATETEITIWGARGSIPAPEKALGVYGGNTACVHVALTGQRHLVFDAGTGIRGLGLSLSGLSPMRMALLLTHYHWDHTHGLPFFTPLYLPANTVDLYGPAESDSALSAKIRGEMGGDYFPISFEAFRASVQFVSLTEQSFSALGLPLKSLYASHPGRTLAYRVELERGAIVYAPDNELLPESVLPEISGEALRMADFARGAAVLIHDCTYSRVQYEQKRAWGHSCAEMLARVAAHADVKRVLLFHHDPDNDDATVDEIHREFETTVASLGKTIASEPAREGSSILM